MNINKAMICGRTTNDLELKKTTTGRSVLSFSLATNRKWKDQDGNQQEKGEFHNIVAWGKQAEVIAQYVTKGQGLYVEGHLETRTWEDEGGKKNYRTEVILDQFEFGAKPAGSTPAPQAKVNPHYKEEDAVKYPDEEIDPDDIPF